MKITNKTTYLTILTIYFIAKYFEYTTVVRIDGISNIIDIIKNTCYIIFLMLWGIEKLVKPKISIIYCIIILILFIYFGYQGFVKGRADIFGLIMCGLNFKKEYLDIYIKKIYTLSIILCFIVILLSVFGIIDNEVNSKIVLGSLMYRMGYGYTYSGQLASMLIPIVFMYYYLNQKRIKVIINIIWLIVDLIFFSMAKTYMSFLLVLVFIFLFNLLGLKNEKPMRSIISKCLVASPCICVLINILLLYFKYVGLKVVDILDLITNNRIGLGVKYIQIYGIKLFGTNFVNDGNSQYGYQILDSDYTYTLVACGVIYFIVMCVIMTVIMYYVVYYMKNKTMILIWLLIFINSIVNNGIFNIIVNPFCIFLFPAIDEYLKIKKWGLKKYNIFRDRTQMNL